jgi:D-alanyl-D-alanine carboxypeptidase
VKLFRAIVFFSLVLLASSKSFAKDFPNDIREKLNTETELLAKSVGIPGLNVGIWVPEDGEWVNSFGLSDKTTRKKMDRQDHFRIGSITKTFVTTAVLQLSDEGKLSLSDKISKYVSNVPNGDKITIKNLANMTSGLANYTENDNWLKKEVFAKGNTKVITAQDVLDVAFKMPIKFEPDKGWQYSNTNTVLLGLVIEKVSGMSLPQYLNQNILKPLGLNNTIYPTNASIPAPYAHGYTKQTIDDMEDEVTSFNPFWTNAAGQMISTFDDMKIWAKALGTGKLLKPNTFKVRLEWDKIPPNTEIKKYGFGIAFNNGWITHTGSLPGYNCVIGYLPEKAAIFVAMINSDIDYAEKGKKSIPLAELVFEAVTKIATPDNVYFIKR